MNAEASISMKSVASFTIAESIFIESFAVLVLTMIVGLNEHLRPTTIRIGLGNWPQSSLHFFALYCLFLCLSLILSTRSLSMRVVRVLNETINQSIRCKHNLHFCGSIHGKGGAAEIQWIPKGVRAGGNGESNWPFVSATRHFKGKVKGLGEGSGV